MNFLRRFWAILTGSSRAFVPDSGYPLTRFVYSSRSINADRVKANAFLPPPNPPHGETSVFQILGLDSQRVWALKSLARQDKEPRGRADFTEEDLNSPVDLTFRLNDTPPRHGNLAGWPPGKDERKEVAQALAARAIPLLPPND